jgi:hypothetical protein
MDITFTLTPEVIRKIVQEARDHPDYKDLFPRTEKTVVRRENSLINKHIGAIKAFFQMQKEGFEFNGRKIEVYMTMNGLEYVTSACSVALKRLVADKVVERVGRTWYAKI